MSRAKVSIEDVNNVSNAVSVAESTATSTVAQIKSSVDNNISMLESAYQQIETVLSACNRSLIQLQRMCMEAERHLNALKKEFCNTPKTVTGEEGEQKTNPRYIQLQHEISSVTQKIGEYNSLTRNFNALASDCAKQKEMISAAKYSLSSICDELKAIKDKYTTKCETAIKRLSDINAMIDAYMSVRISGGSSFGAEVSYSAPAAKSGGFGSFVTKIGAAGAMFIATLSGATPDIPMVEQPQEQKGMMESIGDSVNAGKIEVNGYEVVLDDSVQREESVEHLPLKEGARKMVELGGDIVENVVDSLEKKKRAEKEMELAAEENNKPKATEPHKPDESIFITVDKDGKIVKYDVKCDIADNNENSTISTASYNAQLSDKSGDCTLDKSDRKSDGLKIVDDKQIQFDHINSNESDKQEGKPEVGDSIQIKDGAVYINGTFANLQETTYDRLINKIEIAGEKVGNAISDHGADIIKIGSSAYKLLKTVQGVPQSSPLDSQNISSEMIKAEVLAAKVLIKRVTENVKYKKLEKRVTQNPYHNIADTELIERNTLRIPDEQLNEDRILSDDYQFTVDES